MLVDTTDTAQAQVSADAFEAPRQLDALSTTDAFQAITSPAGSKTCSRSSQPSFVGIEPMKSILPRSTPLWRRIAYVIVAWKKKFGIATWTR